VMLGPELTSHASAGASLVAAFGLGNLAGSALVTVFPLRGEPERLTTRWVGVMAVALGICALAPSYPLALAAFALAGASNAPFFTATLAARSRYSPAAARAQVFVSLAGVKVAMASAGTALAGAAAGAGPRVLLAAGAALTLGAACTTLLDRRLSLRQADLQRPKTTPCGSAA
jgi:predicted MFS family arabinose efflux permease